MNKSVKGFTLVELLGVLVILSVILSITITVVTSIISSSKKSLTDTQIFEIEEAAKVYHLSEGMNVNLNCVNLEYLIEKGYIKSKEIKNIENDEILDGSVLIKYEANDYSYEYQNNRCPA